jgi:hypothetical protein
MHPGISLALFRDNALFHANLLVIVGQFVLAAIFGSLVTLIIIELRKHWRQARSRSQSELVLSQPERERRQALVSNLMGLYSGVHSSHALEDFLNKELERRHESWRVRIPPNGPGEIHEL